MKNNNIYIGKHQTENINDNYFLKLLNEKEKEKKVFVVKGFDNNNKNKGKKIQEKNFELSKVKSENLQFENEVNSLKERIKVLLENGVIA